MVSTRVPQKKKSLFYCHGSIEYWIYIYIKPKISEGKLGAEIMERSTLERSTSSLKSGSCLSVQQF